MDSVISPNFLEEFQTQPHRFLGLHPTNTDHKVIRVYRPGAVSLMIEICGVLVEGHQVGESGVFEWEVAASTTRFDYKIYHHNGLLAHDPYVFSPTWGEIDAYLFAAGVHYELYNVLGGRVCLHEGVWGVKFALWAPEAKKVALVCDTNLWDGRALPMRSMGSSGIFELFVPGLRAKEKYKFEITTQRGDLLLKADPCATWSEIRPHNASIVFDVEGFTWQDAAWFSLRPHRHSPIAIYEVHLGSWKKEGGEFLSYRELAAKLGPYCVEMGFSHVELLPITEHPLDESWGYQVSGFFAATSRHGSPEDFQYFVNELHRLHIGVILDFVPAHFPSDGHGLFRFDGSCLYEHADPRQGFHPHWNTLIFNYGRKEVANFLIASALFWLETMHVDGLRVDAVASMLYLDYGRKNGEWIPNIYGGKENLEAIAFLKHFNAILHERVPGVLTFAEESTSFLGVTHSLHQGGLGFDFKWNMGWMNDTLRYFSKDPIFRAHHHEDLTFGLLYAFSESFLLPLSHDEVVHEKGSLLTKMPGDRWQQIAGIRLLYSYQICQVGKKLLFMGGELGQIGEWNAQKELEWDLLLDKKHAGLQRCVRDLNLLYKKYDALWSLDHEACSFAWVDCSDRHNGVISYIRQGKTTRLLCVHHMTPAYFDRYCLPFDGDLIEVMNTDRVEYGGSGKVGREIGRPSYHKVEVTLPPLSTIIFEIV